MTPEWSATEENEYQSVSRALRRAAFGKYREVQPTGDAVLPAPSREVHWPGPGPVHIGKLPRAPRAKNGTQTRAEIQAAYRAKVGKLKCSVEGCEKGQHSGGKCPAHDIAARRERA